MTYQQPYYQGYGQQPNGQPYPQQRYQQQPYPAPRIPSPYGWGIIATAIGVLMLFAGLAAPALTSATPSVDCTSQERRVSTLTADLEAAQASRNAIPATSRSQRAAADRRVTEVSKQRNTAILDRDRCASTANTGAASGVASLVVLIGGFAPLTIGIGITRILAGGDLLTRLGGAVHRRVARVRASRPAPQFAPVQPQPQQVYEPQPQFVQDFPMDYDEPAAPTPNPEPEPTPEPERPREGWGTRRNLDFGGD